MKVDQKEYFTSLTSLRGIAALWVALFHVSWILPSETLFKFLPIIHRGYLGVDFFFMLSGFVLWHAYRPQDMITTREYLIFSFKRIRRIIPTHIVVLVVFFVIYSLFHYVGISVEGNYGIKEFILQLFLFQTIPIGGDSFFSWNYPTWTLGIEVWWFIFLICIASFLSRLSIKSLSRNWYMMISYSFLLVLCVILIYNQSPAYINDPNFYSSLVRSGLELGAGIFLYLAISVKKFTISKIQLLIFIALLLFAIIGWLFVSEYIMIVYWLLFMPVLIIMALDIKGIVYHFLNTKWMLYLGTISYSLYLVHGPVERITSIIYTDSIPAVFWYTGFLTVIILAGMFFYRFVERFFIK